MTPISLLLFIITSSNLFNWSLSSLVNFGPSIFENIPPSLLVILLLIVNGKDFISFLKRSCNLLFTLIVYNPSVVTINLGFVDTPMTKKFKKNFLWSSANEVAIKITQSIDKKKGIVYIPQFWILIMFLIKIIPEKIFERIKL